MQYLVLQTFICYGKVLKKGTVVDESEIRSPRLRLSEGKITPAVSSFTVPAVSEAEGSDLQGGNEGDIHSDEGGDAGDKKSDDDDKKSDEDNKQSDNSGSPEGDKIPVKTESDPDKKPDSEEKQVPATEPEKKTTLKLTVNK